MNALMTVLCKKASQVMFLLRMPVVSFDSAISSIKLRVCLCEDRAGVLTFGPLSET